MIAKSTPVVTPQRGDIFFTSIPYHTGCEMDKDRPCLIVSCDRINSVTPCVIVVPLSTSKQDELPWHVTVRATGKPSIALCEHLYTVDKQRLLCYDGRATEQEMQAVDIALSCALSAGLQATEIAQTEKEQETAPTETESDYDALYDENIRLSTENAVYRKMYDDLLEKLLK